MSNDVKELLSTITTNGKTVAENRATWVEALRSGKYQQGQGCLKKDLSDGTTRYCCIGVACEIFGIEQSKSVIDNAYYFGAYNRAYAPEQLKKLLYMDTIGSTNRSYLTALNDRGVSFERIADMIEAGELKVVMP